MSRDVWTEISRYQTTDLVRQLYKMKHKGELNTTQNQTNYQLLHPGAGILSECEPCESGRAQCNLAHAVFAAACTSTRRLRARWNSSSAHEGCRAGASSTSQPI
jgi:hypothetical protein